MARRPLRRPRRRSPMQQRPLRVRVHRRCRMPAPRPVQRRAAGRTATLQAPVHRELRTRGVLSATRICGSALVRRLWGCSGAWELVTCLGRCWCCRMAGWACSGCSTCAGGPRLRFMKGPISRRWRTGTGTTPRGDGTKAALRVGSWRSREERGQKERVSTSRSGRLLSLGRRTGARERRRCGARAARRSSRT